MFSKLKSKFGASAYDLLVVGLGNPGIQYEETRHNVGFRCIDALCEKYNIKCDKSKFSGYVCDLNLGGKRVLLLKPLTYMNNSGEAVSAAASFYKIPNHNILVLYDDVSLKGGTVRMRTKGSAGGHNGIKSIIASLGTDEFPRVKIGVGEKPRPDFPLDKWVLAKISDEDKETSLQAEEKAVSAVEEVIKNSLNTAMNKYSR